MPDDLTWHKFFTQFALARPTALEQITITPQDLSITEESLEQDEEEQVSVIDEAWSILENSAREGKQRRVFAYSHADFVDHWNYRPLVLLNHPKMRTAVINGRDQEGWEMLMSVVDENCKRIDRGE